MKNLNLKGIYIDSQLCVLPFQRFGFSFIGIHSERRWRGATARAHFDKSLNSGENLVLTIDHIIQKTSRGNFKNLIDRYQAVGGTVIVQNRTGKILAMEIFRILTLMTIQNLKWKIFLIPAVSVGLRTGFGFQINYYGGRHR